MRAGAPRFALTSAIDAIGWPAPPLISDAAQRALRRITDRIPAGLSNRLYIECRLAAAAPVVDIVMCADDRNRDVLTDGHGRHLPDRLREDPVWDGTIHLFEWWAGAHRSLSRAVAEVWLEFDAPDAAAVDHLPVPCVFLAFPRIARPADLGEVVADSFALLRGAPFTPHAFEGLARAIACLPDRAGVAYAGLMCSRDLDSVRLCLSTVERDAVVGYLEEIGWPGSAAALADWMRALSCPSVPDPLGSVALLHVDVGARTAPRVGAEICFDRSRQLRAITAERDLLDRLCALGLSTTAKRDAMLQWPGHTLARFAHEVGESLVVRRINGIKLVFVGESIEAKAYLTAFHEVRQSARLRRQDGVTSARGSSVIRTR